MSRRRRSIVDGVALFSVRGVSALPAAARARLIRDRIEAAAVDPALAVDALRIVDTEGVIKILAGDRLILGVVEADATLEQVSRVELATAYRQRIRQAIAEYRAARSSRRPAPCGREHAARHPPAGRRPVGSRTALAWGGWAGDAATADAYPHGRHPVVRGDTRRPDLVSGARRAAPVAHGVSCWPASWSTSDMFSPCGHGRAACRAGSSASPSRLSR